MRGYFYCLECEWKGMLIDYEGTDWNSPDQVSNIIRHCHVNSKHAIGYKEVPQ